MPESSEERDGLPVVPRRGDAELKHMMEQLPRDQVFNKFPQVVLRGHQELRDIGFRRTRCFSTTGLPKDHFCAPAVLVAGYEKCGTSALYHKLSRHPEILAHPSQKEHCPKNDTIASTWEWLQSDQMPRIFMERSDHVLLNGCIGLESKALTLTELLRISPDTKILVSLRNFADWAYSYYSYRCVPGYDIGCEELRSPNEKGPWKNSRTPENFDKIVKSVAHSSEKENNFPPAFRVFRPSVSLYRPWLENLVRIAGRDSLLVLRREDLAFRPNQVLRKVARFTGINERKFPPEAITLVSNTNDKPGQVIDAKQSSRDEISAAVNSGSAIFPKTRSLLNKFWKEECVWLRDSFGVHFKEAC